MKFFLVLFLIPLGYVFGESDSPQTDLSYDEYKPESGSTRITYHDLSMLGNKQWIWEFCSLQKYVQNRRDRPKRTIPRGSPDQSGLYGG